MLLLGTTAIGKVLLKRPCASLLSGDSDTIGSMAGAIAGARFGMSSIPKELMRICEGVDHAEQQADKMFNLIKADFDE